MGTAPFPGADSQLVLGSEMTLGPQRFLAPVVLNGRTSHKPGTLHLAHPSGHVCKRLLDIVLLRSTEYMWLFSLLN